MRTHKSHNITKHEISTQKVIHFGIETCHTHTHTHTHTQTDTRTHMRALKVEL